jgi:hypothetical protein
MNLVNVFMYKSERASVSVNFGLIQRLSRSDPTTKDNSLSLNCKGHARLASKLARCHQEYSKLALVIKAEARAFRSLGKPFNR